MAGPTGRYDSTILNSLRVGRGKGKFNKLKEREAEFEDYTRQRDPEDIDEQREQYERAKPERLGPGDEYQEATAPRRRGGSARERIIGSNKAVRRTA